MAHPQQQQPMSAPIKFSNEELRVLQQCNRESFYQRSLPFSTLSGVATYWAVKSGRLLPNPKYGAVPKVVAAVTAGYILGKISYQSICAEKLMALPDSRVGQILRNRRAGVTEGPSGFTLGLPNEDEIVQSLSPADKYQDHSKSQLDMDFDRPSASGLDDTFRPRIDDFEIPLPAVKDGLAPPSVSYEELRRKNREEYEMQRNKPYSRSTIAPDEVPSALRQRDEDFARQRAEPKPDIWSRPAPRTPTNAYGDIFEK